MAFDNLNLSYLPPIQREFETGGVSTLRLTPFNVQRIVVELVRQHWLYNNPSINGYTFQERYAVNDSDSDVYIDVGFNLKMNPVSKRPSIIVTRSDANYGALTINQQIENNPKESEKVKLHTITMGLSISVIASPVALAETMAEWTAQPLEDYEEQIRTAFKMRRFRMAAIQRPQLYKEAKDFFIVVIPIEVVFDSRVVIRKEDLKLKTVARSIFLGMNNQPLTEQ